MKTGKRALVLMLSVLMMFSTLPVQVIAENEEAMSAAGTAAVQEEKKDESVEPAAEPEQAVEESEKPAEAAEPAADDAAEEEAAPVEEQADTSAEQKDGASESAAEEEKTETAAETEQTEEAAEEQQAPETEEDADREESYPAVTLHGKAAGVSVTLKAPEGSLPAGVSMKVRKAGGNEEEAVADYLESQGRTLTDSVALDITLHDKSGKEIEPKIPVQVTFNGTDLDVEEDGFVEVYRVCGNNVEKMGSGTADKQTFTADHFTVYVSGGNAGNPNADGGTVNDRTHRLVLKYGETVQLCADDIHGHEDAHELLVYIGGDYVEITQAADVMPRDIGSVKNINSTCEDQNVTIEFRYRSLIISPWTKEYYYITCEPQRLDVTYKVCEPGSDEFTEYATQSGIRKGQSAPPQTIDQEKEYDGTVYKFFGWYTDESCSTKADLSSVMSNVTVYGKYALGGNTLTYDANIADSTAIVPETSEVGVGNTVIVGTATVENGYVFDYWSTKDDGSGTTYKPGDTFTMPDEDVTLYAQWKEATFYTVSFDMNGHGTAPDSQSVQSGKTASEPQAPASIEEGEYKYVFDDWYKDKDCKNIYDFSEPITKDTTLYAKWSKGKIISDLSGMTVTPDPLECGYEFSNKPVFNTSNDKVKSLDLISAWYGLLFRPVEDEKAVAGTTYWAGTLLYTSDEDNKETYYFSSDLKVPEGFIVVQAERSTAIVMYTVTAQHNIEELAAKEVTCTEDGNIACYHCSGCDKYFSDAEGKNEITKDSAVIEATGHDWGEWIVTDEPTVYKDGERQRVCKNDPSHVETEVIPKLESYTVTLDPNGGTLDGSSAAQETKVEKNTSFTLPTASWNGYTLLGWTDEKYPEKPKYAAGESIEVTGDITLYAMWQKDLYTVTFDPGEHGAWEAVSHHNLEWGDTMPARPENYTVSKDEGYEFDKWSPTVGPKVNRTQTYTAKWKAIPYSITYDLAGGELAEGESNPETYTADDEITLTNPTRDGYVFAGWTGTDLSSPTVDVTIAKGSTGDRTYTATWTEAKVTITYEVDGHGYLHKYSETVKAVTGQAKGSKAAPDKGYVLVNWTDEEGNEVGTDREFIPEKTDGVYVEATYTAHFKPIEYTITYNNMEGAVVDGTNPATYTIETDDFTLINPTKEGYTFLGWTGTGITGGKSMSVTVPKGSYDNRKYKANWQENKATITYTAGKGGDVSRDSEDVKVVTGTPKGCTAEPASGYKFVNWTDADGEEVSTETKLVPEKTGDLYEDVTYTANFEPIVYTITYDLDGGEAGGENPETYTVESEDFTLANPTKDNYTFAGWTGTDLDSATEEVTVAQGSTGDREYTATWTENEVTITYEAAEGGSVDPEEETLKVITGEAEGSTAAPDSRHDFVNWTDEEGNVVSTDLTFVPEKVDDLNVEATYTANFKLKEFDITYDLGGGEYNGSTDDIVETHEIGEVITIHEAPTREGYEFVEWRGSSYQPGDSYTVSEDHTFTAIWTAATDDDDDSDTDEDSDESSGVKTGDNSQIFVWLAVLAAAVIACVVIFFKRRRDN